MLVFTEVILCFPFYGFYKEIGVTGKILLRRWSVSSGIGEGTSLRLISFCSRNVSVLVVIRIFTVVWL